MSDVAGALEALLSDHVPRGLSTLADRVGFPLEEVREALGQLQEDGDVERYKGAGIARYWIPGGQSEPTTEAGTPAKTVNVAGADVTARRDELLDAYEEGEQIAVRIEGMVEALGQNHCRLELRRLQRRALASVIGDNEEGELGLLDEVLLGLLNELEASGFFAGA